MQRCRFYVAWPVLSSWPDTGGMPRLLQGMPLEDWGGLGIALSHWKSNLAQVCTAQPQLSTCFSYCRECWCLKQLS
jgi:hypothetical protein